jgi:sugar O-acyltransferase (sialic acid O-acetyltransferase NeuD family)
LASNIIIFGTGKHAELACFLFREDTPLRPVCFCFDESYGTPPEKSLLDLPVLSLKDVLEKYQNNEVLFHVAIGNNLVREKYFHYIQSLGYRFASYISSFARCWKDLKTGENCFISQGAVIQPMVTLGNNTIVMGASIGHHTRIGSHVLLSNPVIGGSVEVGDFTFIGMNAVIREKINIGRQNIIGAGSIIMNDTQDDEVYSVPSTKKRSISASQVTLFK